MDVDVVATDPFHALEHGGRLSVLPNRHVPQEYASRPAGRSTGRFAGMAC
ncbi:hypothetical protein [Nonomuraea sp. NPDC050783]